jgi:hypothetical protein
MYDDLPLLTFRTCSRAEGARGSTCVLASLCWLPRRQRGDGADEGKKVGMLKLRMNEKASVARCKLD